MLVDGYVPPTYSMVHLQVKINNLDIFVHRYHHDFFIFLRKQWLKFTNVGWVKFVD